MTLQYTKYEMKLSIKIVVTAITSDFSHFGMSSGRLIPFSGLRNLCVDKSIGNCFELSGGGISTGDDTSVKHRTTQRSF